MDQMGWEGSDGVRKRNLSNGCAEGKAFWFPGFTLVLPFPKLVDETKIAKTG